ncbi:hypothetical protein [Streptomyces sp. 891-h]|uniref:hypothetical protein n=1 Tax=unclassified Streptomyces TaxID=2593676 RepID=UPI001FAAC9F7|nr:hypothetical protein [Streptomyces sp. 891-h]UNZ19526.1 hypothetical protein HC362_23310 [Streptomyces sp. 891-h]
MSEQQEEQHSERDQMSEEEPNDAAQAPTPDAEPESAPEPKSAPGPKSAPEPKSAAPAPGPVGRVRRFFRGKPGVAVVGAVVGALLAGGTMAWRAGELPFVPRDVCWGSLSPDTVDRLFSDGEIRTKELSLRSTGEEDGYSTECRLQRWEDDELKWQISARVRQLEQFNGRGAREWTREFLSPAMVPLGDGIPGMVSGTRAWVALPQSCTGGASEDDPPTVVSLSSGSLDAYESDPDEARTYRKVLADAVVELTNGVLASRECQGRYPKPGKLAPLPERRDADTPGADELCGLKGTRLPARMKDEGDFGKSVRVTTDVTGPAHSCEYGRNFDLDATRFTTIEDPHLAGFVEPLAYSSPVRFRGDGFGGVFGDMSVYVATCQTGHVAFLVQQEDFLGKHAPMIELLPAYVAAEAKRIGCGKVRVTGPERTS